MSIIFLIFIVFEFFLSVHAAGNISFLESRTHLEGARVLMQEARQGKHTMLGNLRRYCRLSFGSQGEIRRFNKIIVTKDKTFNWLMDKNGKMYGIFDDLNNHVFQSSLLGNDWPLAVGTLKTDKEGLLLSIDNRSMLFAVDHPSFKLALKMLRESGATLPSSEQSISFYPSNDEAKFQACLNRFNVVDLKNAMRTGVLEKTMHAHLQQDMVVEANKPDFFQDLPRLLPTEVGMESESSAFLHGILNDNYHNLADYRLSMMEDGPVFNPNFAPISKKSVRLKWIVNHQGNIYVAPFDDDSLIIEHSRLVGHEWPASAGEMVIQHGVITEITNESKFFKPSRASFEGILSYLRQYGIPFSPYKAVAKDYDDVKRITDMSVVEYRDKFRQGDFFFNVFTGKDCFWNSAAQ